MILLKIKNEKVIGAYLDISPDYKPKENEVLVEKLPQISLKENEKVYLYYRNGKIEYKKESKI